MTVERTLSALGGCWRCVMNATNVSPPMILGRPNSSKALMMKLAASPATATHSPSPSATHDGAWATDGSTVIVRGERLIGAELHETASE